MLSSPYFTEISLNADSVGLKYLKAKSAGFEVERGDVLAIKLTSGEGDLGHSTDATAWEYHASPLSEVFPGTVISSVTSKPTIKHNVRAHFSTTSKFKIDAKFVEAGFAYIQVEATNPKFAKYVDRKYFHVQVRMNNIFIFLNIKKIITYCTKSYILLLDRAVSLKSLKTCPYLSHVLTVSLCIQCRSGS